MEVFGPYLRSVARAKLTLAMLARNHGHHAGKGLSLRPVIAAPCLFIGPNLPSGPLACFDPPQQHPIGSAAGNNPFVVGPTSDPHGSGETIRQVRSPRYSGEAHTPHFKEASSPPRQRRVGRLFCSLRLIRGLWPQPPQTVDMP